MRSLVSLVMVAGLVAASLLAEPVASAGPVSPPAASRTDGTSAEADPGAATADSVAADSVAAGDMAAGRSESAAWAAPLSTERMIQKMRVEYAEIGFDPSIFFVDYSYSSSYLHFERTRVPGPDSSALLDTAGVPQVLVDGARHYNTVQVAQYTLGQYGRILARPDSAAARDGFDAGIRRLLALQSNDGAFRYSFSFQYYLNKAAYRPGWVSAMAQGQAISAFVRAYLLDPQQRYLDAARRAYAFLQVPISRGGVRSDLGDLDPKLAGHVFYEEYASQPDGYTLNGYLFTMLGISDWCQLTERLALPDRVRCAKDFAAALDSLRLALPNYDLGTFSSYDLGHITSKRRIPHMASRYHNVHIYLLHALYARTADPLLAYYEQRFSWQVGLASAPSKPPVTVAAAPGGGLAPPAALGGG